MPEDAIGRGAKLSLDTPYSMLLNDIAEKLQEPFRGYIFIKKSLYTPTFCPNQNGQVCIFQPKVLVA